LTGGYALRLNELTDPNAIGNLNPKKKRETDMDHTKITQALNEILADMHILNVKLHNFHWNVSGMQFHAIHSATEAYYDHFFAQFDDVAERILQLGSKPVSTTKGYLELATIEEENGTHFEAAYVLQSIASDFAAMLEKVKAANALAEGDGDVGTQDLLSGLIAWFEKEIWIIKSTLGK
jgi:starvation-inducible DNA-binding protein